MKSRERLRFGAFTAVFIAAAVLAGSAQNPVSGVFFSEGWESGSASGTFNSSGYGTAMASQFSVQSQIRASGAWALRHLYPAGVQASGVQYATQHFGDSLAGPVYPAGAGQHFYDLYVQYKVYYSPNFDTTTLTKQLIIGTQDDRRHDNACCNPWVSHYMTIYPEFEGRNWVGEANNKQAASGQWIGFGMNASGYSSSNVFGMQKGRWYTVEVRRRLNDSGVDNGIFQMWVDGVLISDHRNIRFRVPWNGTFGANMTYGTNFVMISDYGGPIAAEQSVYYDDIKMSTSYIGGGATTTPPAPPTNVRIMR